MEHQPRLGTSRQRYQPSKILKTSSINKTKKPSCKSARAFLKIFANSRKRRRNPSEPEEHGQVTSKKDQSVKNI